MQFIRHAMVLSTALWSAALCAQQGDWLIGNWQGAMNETNGRSSPERFMSIKSVQPDGKVTGSWSASPDGTGGKAAMTLTGDALQVVTGGKSVINLKREGDRLTGTMVVPNGSEFPIALVKAADGAPTETFAGTVRGNSSCFANATEMEVIYRGNHVSGFWTTTAGKLHFAGEAAAGKLATAVKIDPAYVVQVKAEKRGDALEASLSSNKGCFFQGTLAKK